MKRILILIPILLLLVVSSCHNEDPVSEIPKGAMVYFSQSENDTPFIDFLNLDNTNLDFTVSMEDAIGRNLEFEPVEYVDVTVTFTNASQGTSDKVVLEKTSDLPKSYNLNIDQLTELYPSTILTKDSLQPGDNFQVTVDIMLENGTLLSGWSPALIDKSAASIYSVLIDYPVTCSSDLAGTYLLETVSGAAGLSSQEVEITSAGPANYVIDDISMEFFAGTPIAYPFSDVCNQIVYGGASRDFGTAVVVEDNGGTSIDPETGVITFDIKYIAPSCCGLQGLTLTFTATPQ